MEIKKPVMLVIFAIPVVRYFFHWLMNRKHGFKKVYDERKMENNECE